MKPFLRTTEAMSELGMGTGQERAASKAYSGNLVGEGS